MTDAITLRLPWPDAALWQNRGSTWSRAAAMVTRAATRSARQLSAWECKAGGSASLTLSSAPLLSWSLHQPPRSRADFLNALAACKPYADGIQDALLIDDNKFLHDVPRGFAERVPGGLIVVTITDGGRDD